MLLAFSQPVNCVFWPTETLNWLVAASKLHKHEGTCYTVEWPYCPFAILWLNSSILWLNSSILWLNSSILLTTINNDSFRHFRFQKSGQVARRELFVLRLKHFITKIVDKYNFRSTYCKNEFYPAQA